MSRAGAQRTFRAARSVNGPGADSPLTELRDTVAPARRALAGRASEIVVGLAVVVTALAALALTGAAVDDAEIDADRGVALAEVLDASFARTLVRFPGPTGQAVVPERGVQYPRGLATGDTVVVEYARSDPEQVRVAGRSVVDGIAPMLLGVAAVWAVLGPLAVWLRRRPEPARRPVGGRSGQGPVHHPRPDGEGRPASEPLSQGRSVTPRPGVGEGDR
jgi:hypothetical protein